MSTGQPATKTWRILEASNRLPSVTITLAILPFSIVPRRSAAPARRAALIVNAFSAESSASPPSFTVRATLSVAGQEQGIEQTDVTEVRYSHR